MQTEVSRRIDDAGNRYFSAPDVKLAINEGYEEMSDASEWYELNAPIALVQDNQYYNLQLQFPSDKVPLSVTSVWNVQTSKWLDPTSPMELDATTFRWGNTSGEPEAFFVRGLWVLGVYPKCAQNSGTLTVYYTAVPDPMVDDADLPGFDQEFHFGLIEYALYDLYSQEEETKQALLHYKQYLEHEKALRDSVKRRTLDRVAGWRHAG